MLTRRLASPLTQTLAAVSILMPATWTVAQDTGRVEALKRQHLLEAAAWARKIDDADLRTRVFYTLARRQARAGAMADALESAGLANANSQLQIYAYLAVAREYGKRGEAVAANGAGELARQTAIMANDGKGRIETHLISWLADRGLVAECLNYLNAMKRASDRTFGVKVLCSKLGEKDGGADEALDVMRAELAPKYHDPTLLMMTQNCARVGPKEQALRYVRLIRTQPWKDKAWLDLITQRRSAGAKEDELQPWIEQIADAEMRSKAAAEAIQSRPPSKPAGVAELQTQVDEAGNRNVKLALLRKLFSSHLKNQAPRKAESAIDQMLRTVDQHPQPKEVTKFGSSDDSVVKKAIRADYIKVATVYAALGEKDEAERCEKEALAAAKSIPDSAGLGKLFILQMVAGEMAKAGRKEAAGKFILEANAKSPFRAFSLKGAAAALAAEGKWDEALAQVKAHAGDQNGYWRSQAVGQIVKEIIKQRQLERGPQFLAALQKTDDDYQAYRVVASEMLKAKHGETLESWLKDAHPAAKAYAAMGRADAE